MLRPLLALVVVTLFSGCNWAEDRTKRVLNKGGELAGSAATEVIEGVTTGVERSWDVRVELSPELAGRGLAVGKTTLEADSTGRYNRIVVYLSAAQEFTDTLTAIAMDQNALEMGRTRVPVSRGADSGDHILIQFQQYTDLERKSRVVLR